MTSVSSFVMFFLFYKKVIAVLHTIVSLLLSKVKKIATVEAQQTSQCWLLRDNELVCYNSVPEAIDALKINKN